MYSTYLFLVILVLIFFATIKIVSKKLDIKNNKLLNNHANETILEAEIILLFAWIVSIFIFSLEFHFSWIWFAIFHTFRAFMEWKFDKKAKRYILCILTASFGLIAFLGIEFVFNNPVPIRLEANQVNEITIEQYSEPENSYTISDAELIKPILSAVSDGQYQMAEYQLNPRLEMTINLNDGKEIIIGEYVFWTSSGDKSSVIFFVHTDRLLFPREMILRSQELELIFQNYADKITGSLSINSEGKLVVSI